MVPKRAMMENWGGKKKEAVRELVKDMGRG